MSHIYLANSSKCYESLVIYEGRCYPEGVCIENNFILGIHGAKYHANMVLVLFKDGGDKPLNVKVSISLLLATMHLPEMNA